MTGYPDSAAMRGRSVGSGLILSAGGTFSRGNLETPLAAGVVKTLEMIAKEMELFDFPRVILSSYGCLCENVLSCCNYP